MGDPHVFTANLLNTAEKYANLPLYINLLEPTGFRKTSLLFFAMTVKLIPSCQPIFFYTRS